jgi:Ca2+-transporting ATPase
MLDRCVDALTVEGRRPLERAEIDAAVERMAADGLRVLAFAMRAFPAVPATLDPDQVETGLTFLGLVGLLDPPRPEAAEAVKLCRRAGITPVMITGDHPATARAIATRLGIIDDSAEVLSGQDLARL